MGYMESKEDAMLKLLAWLKKMNQKFTRPLNSVQSWRMCYLNLELETSTIVTRRLLKMVEFHSHCLTCQIRSYQPSVSIQATLFSWHVIPRVCCHQLHFLTINKLHSCSCQDTQPRSVEQHSTWRCPNQHFQPVLVKFSYQWTQSSMPRCFMKSWKNTNLRFGLSIRGNHNLIQLDQWPIWSRKENIDQGFSEDPPGYSFWPTRQSEI